MAMYMDPLKPYLPELMNMHKLIYPAGDGRINYITRNDIARGVIAIIKIQILGANVIYYQATVMI
ncbi:putative nucleoside-diphosphate-sugar epimerase [Staphylococcus aureus]|uniref:Putative nucleoside-diphosphate-sugar epimerase n=1 Tax=Staphylococcus aureus TaxID=1280 RepID=A0A380DKC6_STAAU|nr:putative nucleoside-diphosphate-sugar epimerase [Staphylococcus aureus]